MNNKKLGNEISVLIDEALRAEEVLHAEYSEGNDTECEELHTYIKRLYMSIGERLVSNRRRENEAKTDAFLERMRNHE